MGLTKMVWFRVVNDLVHDIAAGMWPGMVVALWIVRRGALPVLDAEAVTTLASTWTWVLLAALAAATGQVVSGIVRLGYHYDGVPDEAMSSRGRSALWKHGAFVVLFVASLWGSIAVLQA